MPAPIRSARALLPVLLLLAGCGAAAMPAEGAPNPTGSAESGAREPSQDPSAPSFMKVGSVSFGAEDEAALSAPSASPIVPPADPKFKSGESKQNMPKDAAGAAGQGQQVASESKPDGHDSKEPGSTKNVRGAVVDSSGGLTEDDVRATLAGRQSAFRSCYDIGSQGTPGGFSGTVGLRVTINAGGTVAQAEVMSSNTKNAQVDSCVLSEIRRMKFPAKGSGAVVSFPIDFGR